MSVATAPEARKPLHEQVYERVNGKSFDDDRRPLTPEQSRLARTLGPNETRNKTTRVLTERFLDTYMRAEKGISEKYGSSSSQQHRAWNQVGRLTESQLIQDWDAERFRVNGKDGVSFETMSDALAFGLDKKFKKGTHLAEGLKAALRKGSDYRIKEHTVMGLGRSQYGRYLDDLLRIGTWEMCQEVSVAPLMNLIGNIQVDCGQQTLVTDLVPMKVYKYLKPKAENEGTDFFGIDSPAETVLPKRDKIKFAYAIRREAACKGLDEEMRKVMVAGATQIDRYWAPQIVQLLFGLYVNAADNRWRFNLNGTNLANEYPPAAPGYETAFPYNNMIYNQEDIPRNDDSLFVAVEQIMRSARDFRTGDPVECIQGQIDIVATGFVQVERIRSSIAPVLLSVAVGGAQNPVGESIRQSRSRWNTDSIFDNPWIEIYMREFLALMEPGWTAAQLTSAIDRTFVAGNLKAAMAVQDEWGQEEFDLPTEWTDFDRETIWGRKFMRKSGLATPQPQARFLVRGYPTGVSLPAAPTTA